ncbi:hypothetical protein [Clostridium botulinum]|nr:hypothetical protein [Clostridium botulinum]
MKKNSTITEIKILAKQLKKLREVKPEKYFEYKGRINALYEKEIEVISS